jgi:hypothetical protein
MTFPQAPRWVLTVAITLTLAAAAHACPTCKDAITEGHSGMVQGYFWSILFMMSMPFLIFGGLGTYFYYQVRRARVAQVPVEFRGASASAKSGTAL